jgi:hypothetical protein
VTEAVLRKLEDAFLLGCTDAEACLAADIAPSTLYKYCEENPRFSERKETLKQNPLWKARGVVMDAIKAGDLNAAQELLKRKEGSKVALTGADGGAIATKTVVEFVNAPNPDS